MDKLKKLFLYGLLLFAFFPIIPNRIKGLPVIWLMLIALLLFLKKKKYTLNFKKMLSYASLYILYLLSLFFTSNFVDIDKTLTTRISLLVFPLLFGLAHSSIVSITQKQFYRFLSTYFIVTIVYCGLIMLFFYQSGFLLENVNINLYYNHLAYKMWGINQHPIYAAMFISIAVLFGIQLLYSVKKITFKLGLIIGLIILFAMLLFLSRKGVLLALILALLVFMSYHIKSGKQKKYALFGLIAIGLMILVAPVTQKRFKEVFSPRSYNQIENTNSTSIRFGIYTCVIEKIMEKPILGHGIGDVKTEMEHCYAKTSSILSKNNYNAHNQYLSIWLSCGIFGFLIFIGFIFFNLKMAIQQKNILFLCLLLFFSMLMFFENILERQSGVILFSLIVNFFAFVTIQNRKNSFNFDKLN